MIPTYTPPPPPPSYILNVRSPIGRKRLGQSFWILIWLYCYLLIKIRLDLGLYNSCQIRKIPTFATNNINIWFFKHQTQLDQGKPNLLNLIVSLIDEHTIQVSFQNFLTASLPGYDKINLSPAVTQSKCFSIPSPVCHKISPNPRQSKYVSRLPLVYHKINPSPVRQFKYVLSPSPIYHKFNPRPVRQSPRFFKTNDFLKFNCKISQLYIALLNDFDKTFVFALHNSFSENKIES